MFELAGQEVQPVLPSVSAYWPDGQVEQEALLSELDLKDPAMQADTPLPLPVKPGPARQESAEVPPACGLLVLAGQGSQGPVAPVASW